MIPISLGDIAKIVEGELQNIESDQITQAIPVIDSRLVTPQTFFVALRGQKLDGNEFAREAIEKGAEFVLTENSLDLPSIKVKDATHALMKLSLFLREQLTELKVIGITGSQGKTTTKDMLAQILGALAPTIWTERSFNNELGLPLTLLKANQETKFAVIEMGARHQGDISYLSKIAKPNLGIVLVVGNAHIEIFGSRENIAIAKGELIDSLPDNSIAILGDYDEFTPQMGRGRNIKRFLFGEKKIDDNQNIDVRATDIELREGFASFDVICEAGRASVSLQYVGKHQVPNALAAIAASLALGFSLDQVVSLISIAKPQSAGRMQIFELNNILILDDTYNANTYSMEAALDTLNHFAAIRGGESWAILGKMHELGGSTLEEHQKIGKIVAQLQIDHLVEIGKNGFVDGAKSVENLNTTLHELTEKSSFENLVPFINPGDVVLVKASRAEKLEEIVEQLKSKLSKEEG